MQARWLISVVLVCWWGRLLCAGGGSRDASHAMDGQTSAAHGATESLREAGHALHRPTGFVFDGALTDAIAFFTPHESGHGRSRGACHRPEDHFGLTPETVEARYQALQARRQIDPQADDPLFRSIDADDFDQDFATLRTKARVRVMLPLPPNVKLAANPAAPTMAVWRAVPTVVNAGLTAPYQVDGRLGTLEDQALSAMHAHSAITREPRAHTLARVAAFQEHLFSSQGVRHLARALEAGAPLPDPDPPLTALEQEGKATFEHFCASCHGGPTLTVNTDARFLPVPQRGPLAWRTSVRQHLRANALAPRAFFQRPPHGTAAASSL